MKRYFLLLIFAVIFVAKSFAAPYDHIHLTAPNALEAVNWYVKHFGGEAGRFDRAGDGTVYPIDRVFYDDIALIFFEREPTGGSVGTGSIRHNTRWWHAARRFYRIQRYENCFRRRPMGH